MDAKYRAVPIYDGTYCTMSDGFVPNESVLLADIVKMRPSIRWAVENSFNGLRIVSMRHRQFNGIQYQFYVYLRESQIIYWKLKYHGC